MSRHKKRGGPLRVLLRIYLILFSIGVIAPLLWTLYTSFKTNQEFLLNPWALPQSLQFDNYVRGWTTADIGPYFLNSLYITVIVVVVVALLGSMTAYACTRLRLKGGTVVNTFYMVGMFIPSVLCVVPIFLQMRGANLLDKHLGLILLYIAVNMPFTVYVLCGFFRTMPRELEEAAYLDGCGYFRTFWNILLPLAKPGIATVSIFTFLGTWNEYILAKTVILSPTKSTLPVGLVELMEATNHQADWGALFAGMVIVMIPTLVIYLLFQKYITSGMTAGAIKG